MGDDDDDMHVGIHDVCFGVCVCVHIYIYIYISRHQKRSAQAGLNTSATTFFSQHNLACIHSCMYSCMLIETASCFLFLSPSCLRSKLLYFRLLALRHVSIVLHIPVITVNGDLQWDKEPWLTY